MVVDDTICSDADLQLRLGPDILNRACKDIAQRDALRQVALDDTVLAYSERANNPLPEASLNATILKRPVTARACALILMRAFEVEGDAWEKRRQLYQLEWQAIVSGVSGVTSSSSGSGSSGGSSATVVRDAVVSVRMNRR